MLGYLWMTEVDLHFLEAVTSFDQETPACRFRYLVASLLLVAPFSVFLFVPLHFMSWRYSIVDVD
jgi:hypothetical protein